jgi:hypothetical protein
MFIRYGLLKITLPLKSTITLSITKVSVEKLSQYRRLDWGVDDWDSIPGRGNSKTISPCHCIQTESGAHSASNPMGTGGSYPRNKTARV